MISRDHDTVIDLFGDWDNYSHFRYNTTPVKVNPKRINQEKEDSQMRGRIKINKLSRELKRRGSKTVNLSDLMSLEIDSRSSLDSETLEFDERARKVLDKIRPKKINVITENDIRVYSESKKTKVREDKLREDRMEIIRQVYIANGGNSSAKQKLYKQHYKDRRLVDDALEKLIAPKRNPNVSLCKIKIRKDTSDFEKEAFNFLKQIRPLKEKNLEKFYLNIQNKIVKSSIRYGSNIESIRDVLLNLIPEKYLVI